MSSHHTTIREMPETERPREKLFRSGASALSNTELVAILLGSGTREHSALSLAGRLLTRDASGLLYLVEASPEELCQIEGIGPARASVLIASVELGRRLMTAPRGRKVNVSSPDRIAAIYMEQMRYLKVEQFKVLLLNIKNEIIATEDVSVGSISSSSAHPREVFYGAIRRGASSVILVHNHPSGNPEPSQADLLLTDRLAEAGQLLGIPVLDHIVIGDGIYVSLRSEGKLT